MRELQDDERLLSPRSKGVCVESSVVGSASAKLGCVDGIVQMRFQRIKGVGRYGFVEMGVETVRPAPWAGSEKQEARA